MSRGEPCGKAAPAVHAATVLKVSRYFMPGRPPGIDKPAAGTIAI